MEAIKEKIRNNKTVLIILLALAILIIIIALINRAGLFSRENISNEAAVANIISDFEYEDAELVEVIDSNKNEFVYETIKYPVFSSSDLFDYDGVVNDCGDEIVWVTQKIVPTPAILNTTLRAMFNGPDLEYKPGNFLAGQDNINFVEARIKNGVAEIYLTGEFDFKDKCDSSRMFSQIDLAATQFSTVNNVDIYLNSEKINR